MNDESGGVYVKGCKFCGRPLLVGEYCSQVCQDLYAWRDWWHEGPCPPQVRGHVPQIKERSYP